jgi:hypothetical protein
MRIAAVALVVALAALVSCAPVRPTLPTPVIPPIADRTIVFGQRVGPISLGMSVAQLRATGGAPVMVTPYGAGRTGYFFGTLQILAVIDGGTVVFVAPQDPSYATSGGARIGASEQSLASEGAPAWRHTAHSHPTLCFPDHTLVTLAGDSPVRPSPGGCGAYQICDIAIGGCQPGSP